ncbi:MAG: tRNA (adenosine(37)-N6)-dimethylallyltransferase MiaA [Coriobacteriaceae bacterium]|nr:tRNA (adenosine(37)-N6)-dimethylallyltransferase MiaA [Coriobacteriaceae bacterium]
MDEAICILGPTASGKSELAEELALALDGEIVSADSMQVYRGLDIGTAKIPPDARRVPLHCVDIVDPDEEYSAALYQRDARAAIDDIQARGKLAILCGGTGLYISAALDDVDFVAGSNRENEARKHYTELLDEIGPVGLHDLLEKRDPDSAALIHPNNVRRTIRALELLEEGEHYSEHTQSLKEADEVIPCVRIGLAVDTDILNARIDERVDRMERAGLVYEVQSLIEAGLREAITAKQAIGYKEIMAYLDGTCTKDEAFEQVKRSTRRYAKRQRTWFRNDPRIGWIDVDQGIDTASIEQAKGMVQGHSGS